MEKTVKETTLSRLELTTPPRSKMTTPQYPQFLLDFSCQIAIEQI
jgi:hypothetical protein